MQYVAGEMQKDDYFRIKKIPLLIGGATTSRVHTAVKISPHYEGPVVYVPDASRSVGVAQSLLGEQADAYLSELGADYDKVRHQHANKKQVPLWPLAKARANKWLPPVAHPESTASSPAAGADLVQTAWAAYQPTTPKFIGRREFKNFDLAELASYIDWGPFFQTWDLAGAFPAILDDEIVGVEAQKVFADAQAMLKKIIDGRWLSANGVIGLYPANAVGDDIELYTDETRSTVAMTWYGLRQQAAREAEDDGSYSPNRCLADFVAPKLSTIDIVANSPDDTWATGQKILQIPDYVGVFAVTSGLGVEKKEAQFLADHDDYSAIMLKALADRLAEAFAECLHKKVRTDLWGYAPSEALSAPDLIAEKYQGIRPAPGYPACPDHSAKKDMFALLQCEDIDMTLIESLAMTPAASVSGFYIGHPQASYFNVGKIGDDQLQDMAARRGMEAKDLQRLLAPNL
jgi:5-methyltetrahydrofolate--homocysteine methyltransferase